MVRVNGHLRVDHVHDPFEPDDALLVDDEVRPLRRGHLPDLTGYAVGFDGLQLREVAEEGVGHPQRFREGELRPRAEGADRKDLRIQRLELLILDPPGLQVLASDGREIEDVELQDHVLLADEVTQPDLPARGARQLEVGGFVAHLHGGSHSRDGKDKRQGGQERHKTHSPNNPLPSVHRFLLFFDEQS